MRHAVRVGVVVVGVASLTLFLVLVTSEAMKVGPEAQAVAYLRYHAKVGDSEAQAELDSLRSSGALG